MQEIGIYLSKILLFGNSICILITLIIGISIWRIASLFWKLILLNVFSGGMTELIGYCYALGHNNDAIVFNVYILVLSWLLVFAALNIIRNRLAVFILMPLLFINSGFWLKLILGNGPKLFANWALVSSSVLISGVYLIVFIRLFSNKVRVLKQPLFWLCIATIVYFSANIPIFSMINYLNKNNSVLAMRLYLINVVLGMMYYLIIGYSFILYRKNTFNLTLPNDRQ